MGTSITGAPSELSTHVVSHLVLAICVVQFAEPIISIQTVRSWVCVSWHVGVRISGGDWGRLSTHWEGFDNAPLDSASVARRRSDSRGGRPVCKCGSTSPEDGKLIGRMAPSYHWSEMLQSVLQICGIRMMSPSSKLIQDVDTRGYRS